MAALNQCTFAFSSDTPLVQYYRVCITCTRNNSNTHGDGEEEVTICINCSAICHDGHKLSDVLRQKMFCHCSVKNGGSHCRVMPRDRRHGDSDDESDTCSGCGDMSHSHSHGHGHGSSSSKKRKYNAMSMSHDHCHSHGHDHDIVGKISDSTMDTGNICANNNSHSLILWSRFSKHDQQKKVLQQSHLMNIDEANRLAKETFIKANPWSLPEQDICNDHHYSMSRNQWNHLQLKLIRFPRNSDIPEIWEVGVDSADHFLEEFCSFRANGKDIPQVATSSSTTIVPGSSKKFPSVVAHNRSSMTPSTKTPSKKVILSELHDDDDEEHVLFSKASIERTGSDEAVPEEDTGKKKKGSRPKKEPGAPKGPTPSYMIYCNMTREQHQAANPGASMIELTKIIAQVWKTLSTEDKAVYEGLAKADKMRYNAEMEEYRRKKADGSFIPPEVVPKTKAKPGPKPKPKNIEQVIDPGRHKYEMKEEIDADSQSGSGFEVPHEDEEELYDDGDGAASDFEDL